VSVRAPGLSTDVSLWVPATTDRRVHGFAEAPWGRSSRFSDTESIGAVEDALTRIAPESGGGNGSGGLPHPAMAKITASSDPTWPCAP
jgi:hypothetical protein